MLNGEVKVMLITMCSIKSVQLSDDTRERTYLGDIIRAVLSWDPCLHHCTWVVLGSEWPDTSRIPGEGWPLFDVLADVETGAFGLVLAP